MSTGKGFHDEDGWTTLTSREQWRMAIKAVHRSNRNLRKINREIELSKDRRGKLRKLWKKRGYWL